MEFIQALKAARRSERNVVIPDIKCRSPKEGDLMGRRTPAAVARALIAAGAPVLSVVTEEHHFGGSPEQVIQTAAALRPDYLQLHHRESLRQTEQIVSALAREGVPVIRSIPCPAALRRSQFGTESPEELCRAFADMGVAMLLVDSRTADHAAAAAAETPVAFFREIHARSRIPVMLAGGISPRNVTNILKQSGAEQIDILTGIEERPEIKSPRLIEELWTQMGGCTYE